MTFRALPSSRAGGSGTRVVLAVALVVLLGIVVSSRFWASPPEGTAHPLPAPEPRAVDAAPEEPAEERVDVRTPQEAAGLDLVAPTEEPLEPEPAPPASPEPIRLVLRDALRGEPVEDFAIELRKDGELLERLSSDAEGKAVSQGRYASGTYEIVLLESSIVPSDLAPVVEWSFDASNSALRTLSVRVGPTYVLQSIAPPDLRPEELSFGLQAATDPRSTLPDPWTRARAHANAPEPWVRIPRLAVEQQASGSGGWTLSVATDDHKAFGSIAVASASEGHVERVDVRLSIGRTLQGFVREANGSVVPGATIALYPDGWRVGEATWQTVSGEDGSYALHGLAGGGHKVLLSSERHSLVKTRVTLDAVDVVHHDFVLDATPLGAVRGVLRGFAEDAGQPCTLVLRSKTTPGVAFTCTPTLERDTSGAEIGAFSFGDVSIDDYELTVYALIAGSYTPENIALRPPRTDLVFTRVPMGPTEDLGFLVLDARTREPIDGFHAFLIDQRSSTRSFHSIRNGAVVFPGHPISRPFEWTIVMAGYQPAHGDARAFTVRDPAVAGPDGSALRAAGLFAEVALEPGWGAEFLVQSPQGVLEGAVILLDGIEAARTDASGRARVASPVEPKELEVRHPDWIARRIDASTLAASQLRAESMVFDVLLSERTP